MKLICKFLNDEVKTIVGVSESKVLGLLAGIADGVTLSKCVAANQNEDMLEMAFNSGWIVGIAIQREDERAVLWPLFQQALQWGSCLSPAKATAAKKWSQTIHDKFIVIKTHSATEHALHPHVTLWRSAGDNTFEEYKGGTKWLGDFGLGDYENDVKDAVWVKKFDSIGEAIADLPPIIVEHLAASSQA